MQCPNLCSRVFRASVLVVISCLLAASAATAAAPANAKHPFDIQAADAAVSLKLFVAQSGEPVAYSPEAVRGTSTNAVKGDLPAREALARLLAGTALTVTESTGGAVSVGRKTDAAAPATSGAVARARSDEGATDPSNTVVLNAFEVHADPDNSYGALETNSITRFRTDLETLPVDASVFTKTFMDDVAATSVEEMLVQYAGAYGMTADPSANGINGQAGDWVDSSNGGISIGGLTLKVRRDGFLAMSSNTKGPIGSTDNFSTERAEVIRGPQSLLYGGAGGGGIANIVSKQARFNHNGGSIRTMLDQYGSKRVQADYAVGRKNVGIVVSLLNSNRGSQRVNIDSRGLGAYAQVAFRLPHHTLLRVWGQDVKTWSNNSARFTGLNSGNLTATNLQNFSPAGTVISSTDPRIGHNLRYLLATGQDGGLHVGTTALDLNNIDSFGSRWQSDIIEDRFLGVSLETVVTPWLSTQFAAVIDRTEESLIQPGKTLLAPGASGNPFPGEFAVQMATNGSLNGLLPARRHAVRFSALVEKGLFDHWFETQTIVGVEGFSERKAVINETYFKTDANGVFDTSGNPNTAYGRTTLPTQFFSVQHGIPRYPLAFTPGAEKITVNGVHYALAPLRLPNASLITAQNPLGIVGGSGSYNRSSITTHSYYLAHVSGFWHNRLKFLGGGRYDKQSGWQGGISSTGLKNNSYQRSKLSYNMGLNFTARPGLNLFVSQSTAFDPDTSTSNPIGIPLLSSVSRGYQAGVRYHTPEHGFGATLTYLATTGTNQTQLVDQTWVDAINPAGINGRYTVFTGGVDRWVNVDRESKGLRLQMDLHPTKNWRATLNGMLTRSIVASNGTFNQVYNDQFYEKNGVVNYADGTPVLVDPAGGNGAKNTPLTLDMLNNPASKWYANPDADSGHITNALLITTLTTDVGHGTANTGVAGLPISAIQYTWTDPFGHNGVLQPVAGRQYSPGPQFAASFYNHYDFRDGWLKGFGVGGGVSASWRNYAYYYTVGGTKATAGSRVPFMLPSPAVLEYSLSYSRKVGRKFTFRTQLNVKNALNHYYYIIVPTASNGVFENARIINSERSVVWTNSVSF